MAGSSVPVTEGESEQRDITSRRADAGQILAPHALSAEALYQQCEISRFNFADTSELSDLTELIGQDRALKAIEFGASIDREAGERCGEEWNYALMYPSACPHCSCRSGCLYRQARKKMPSR